MALGKHVPRMCLYLEKQVVLVFTKGQVIEPVSYFQWTGNQDVRSIKGTRRGSQLRRRESQKESRSRIPTDKLVTNLRCHLAPLMTYVCDSKNLLQRNEANIESALQKTWCASWQSKYKLKTLKHQKCSSPHICVCNTEVAEG